MAPLVGPDGRTITGEKIRVTIDFVPETGQINVDSAVPPPVVHEVLLMTLRAIYRNVLAEVHKPEPVRIGPNGLMVPGRK